MPSFNQGRFLGRTLRSIIRQDYVNTEIVVIDGGSNDNTIDVIKSYGQYIDYWVSEPDRGQSHAINKALGHCTGDLIGWQNSDDVYLPGAFSTLVSLWESRPNADCYFGNSLLIDSDDEVIAERRYVPFSLRGFLFEGYVITNQSAFFRGDAFRALGVDESLRCAMDADLFIRLALNDGEFAFCRDFLGALRIHPDTKGVTISESVGTEEWITLRNRYGIQTSDAKPIFRQHLWRRGFYLTRRLTLYVLQGDAPYILRGVLRRLRRRQPTTSNSIGRDS